MAGPQAGEQQPDDGHTDAERIARQAAEDAGWRIRWPRIRMMSQSPDLAPTQSRERKDTASTSKPATTWAQLWRFVCEVTEIFGQPAAEALGPQLPLDGVAEHMELDGQHAAAAGLHGDDMCERCRVRSFVGNSSTEPGATEPAEPVQTRRQKAAGFARRYPLLALVLAWIVLVVLDWCVTAAAPRLLSLLTLRPWSPFSESLVMRASLGAAPGLLMDDGASGAQVMRLIRRRLVRGELWIDEFLWTLQLFVCDTLVPLTRPYAVHWLCFALVSLKLLRRCSKIGRRAVLLYALYFAAVDLALWRMLGSPQMLSPDPALCVASDGACSVPTISTLAAETDATTASDQWTGADGGARQVPPHQVRSPFADAVAEALEQKHARMERRRERMRGLHEWRRRQAQSDGAGSRMLPLLATLAVYVCAAAWMRKNGVPAGRMCTALMALDVVSRSAQPSPANSALSLANMLPLLHPRMLLKGGVSGLLATAGGATSHAAAAAFPRVSAIGCVLPIHALGTFSVLAINRLAFLAHSMRVWYATTIRDRRRGPAMVSGQSPKDSRAITLASPLKPSTPVKSAMPETTRDSGAAQPVLTLSQVAGRARAPFAHRVCFLCLSGFCERCLLSMSIWPTGLAESDGSALAPTHADSEPGPRAVDSGSAVTSPAHPRRRSRAHSRHQRQRSRSTAGGSADAQAAEPESGLPPLRDTLLGLGLLNPALNSDGAGQHVAGGGSGRRGKHVDMWIASSVAHCPCRAVHGVGPSSFVSRAAKLEFMHQEAARAEPAEFESPRGTLVPLTQYVRELKSLGLVRPVDPASAVFGDDDDPAASVLPLIFGRFTVPANPRAVAAANALLASSATSYAQLMQGQQQQQPAATASGHTPGGTPFLQPQQQPSRILAKPTPLSNARMPSAGSFRVCAESVDAGEGVVRVYVVMTPTLAHLLLTHMRVAPTASVCVPASLAGVMATRVSSSAASGGVAAATSRVADADPFLDHVRVQLARSDIVVRVNGARWADVDVPALLNQSITIRALPANAVYRVCVSLCGLRSDELTIVLPSEDAAVCRPRRVAQLALQNALTARDAAAAAERDAAQRVKRARRDASRRAQHWRGELDALRRAAERQTQADAKLQRRHGQLAEGVQALSREVDALRAQQEQQAAEDDGEHPASSDNDDSEEETAPVFEGHMGFNVLSHFGAHNAKLQRKSHAHHAVKQDTAVSDLEQALSEARQQQSRLEDQLQSLKAERTRLMSMLSEQKHHKQPSARQTIERTRQLLVNANKRLAASKATRERLEAQLEKELEEISGKDELAEDDQSGVQAVLIQRIAALRQSLKQEQSRY
ncbi:hypothetical protein IWW51_000115 [Coemansia sp. RSA 2702]|nr:hypothetical protein IWW54_000613 [Coemansia sp. RSA 2705]KAJ2322371.1 hypothetical protein IWW52_000107 [Coemansia sp. RSA 2704]KAJ2330167.1 hypothetical protein IWW51_000115 [Coemansia sp. RSA 2702]